MNKFQVVEFRSELTGRDPKTVNFADPEFEAPVTLRYYVAMQTTLENFCNKHNNLFTRIDMYCEASGINPDDLLQKVIQNQLDQNFGFEQKIYDPRCNCSPDPFDKIIYDFSNLAEPLRSVFEKLFQNTPLKIPGK